MAVMNFGGVDENVATREEFPLEKAREVMGGIVLEAIGRVNGIVKMNATLACEVQFGQNYSEIH